MPASLPIAATSKAGCDGVAVSPLAEAKPPRRMTSTEMACLVDAALQSAKPVACFDALISKFDALGRCGDALAATYMRELYAMGEIEILLRLRSQWLGKP